MMIPSPLARCAAATCLLLMCTIGMACKPKKTQPTSKKTTQNNADLPNQEPAAWAKLDSEQSIDVLATGNGPVFKLQDFALTPDMAPGDSGPQKWAIQNEGNATILKGSTKWKNHHIDMNWRMRQGNPQARLDMTFNRIGLAHLGETIQSSITLPKGKISFIDNELRRKDFQQQTITLHNWTPGWVKWSNDTHTLTFSEWSFDIVTISPAENGQITLTFVTWNPKQHPPLAACDVKGRETLTLKHHLTLSFGERQDMILGRLPAGFESAIVPLFSDPASHPDKMLKQGKPLDAEDWLLRAKTILHGHSALSDPRYGNGGLLGTNQGGTILAPKALNQARFDALQKDLKQTRAHIARARAPKSTDKAGTYLSKNFPCKAVLGRRKHASKQILIEPGAAHDGSYLNTLKSRIAMVIGDKQIMTVPPAFVPSLPGHLVLPQLSGQRSMLTDQLLSKLYIKRLQKERGIAWFSTPLIATRNPLVDVAADQLLDPERQGHWTLNPLLAKSLGALELALEDRSALLLGVGPLIKYHRAIKTIQVDELPDGSFNITNAGEPINQATFIVRSNTTVVIDKTPLKTTKTVTSEDGSTQTWFWLNLKKGTTHITFQEGQRKRALQPTTWNVKK